MFPLHRTCFSVALVAAALTLTAPRARALPVTHTFTGTVTYVSDGTAGTLDLTGTFSLSQTIVLVTTLERSTPISPVDATSVGYFNPATAYHFTVGSYACSAAGATLAVVTNDMPTDPTVTDEYVLSAGALVAPPIGNATLSTVLFDLVDSDGTVFTSTALPGVMPPMTEFEDRSIALEFVDSVASKFGVVQASIDDVSTPARATTWGGLKALYR